MAETAVADAVATMRAVMATLQTEARAVAVAAAVALTVVSEEEVQQLEVAMTLRVNRSWGRQLGRFQLPDQGPRGQCQSGHGQFHGRLSHHLQARRKWSPRHLSQCLLDQHQAGPGQGRRLQVRSDQCQSGQYLQYQ
jgi:hypothetical protein